MKEFYNVANKVLMIKNNHPVVTKVKRDTPSGDPEIFDLQKAYDSVDRVILWKLLIKRCKNQKERSLVELIVKLHNESTI